MSPVITNLEGMLGDLFLRTSFVKLPMLGTQLIVPLVFPKGILCPSSGFENVSLAKSKLATRLHERNSLLKLKFGKCQSSETKISNLVGC